LELLAKVPDELVVHSLEHVGGVWGQGAEVAEAGVDAIVEHVLS